MAIIKESNINLSSDIGNVLNAAGGSVDINRAEAYFSAAAKINPFAKWKPTQYEAQVEDADYWMAYDGSCQVEVKVVKNNTGSNSAEPLKQLKAMFQNGDTGWMFKYWEVSNVHPYRLGDFRRYKTDARTSAIIGEQSPSSVIGQGFYPPFIGVNLLQRMCDEYELRLSDICYDAGAKIENFHQALLYWSEAEQTPRIINKGARADGYVADVPYNTSVPAYKGGRYYLCPVLSSYYSNDEYGSIGGGDVLIPFPGAKMITIDTVVPIAIFIDRNSVMMGDANNYKRYKPRVYFKVVVNDVSINNYECAWFYHPIKSDGTVMTNITLSDTSAPKVNYSVTGEYSFSPHLGDTFIADIPPDVTLKGFRGVCQSQVTGDMIEFDLAISYGTDF